MPQPTIAVDLDDVLAMHAAVFVNFSNEQHETNYRPEDYDDDWRAVEEYFDGQD